VLATGAGGPGFKIVCVRNLLKTLSVHPAGNGCQVLLRAGEVEGAEQEEWHPSSITMLPV